MRPYEVDEKTDVRDAKYLLTVPQSQWLSILVEADFLIYFHNWS